MPTIELKNVTKLYKVEGRKEQAIDDINLRIEQGEFVFLVGSSGAGKSTLLSVMTGKLRPETGSVLLDNTDIARFPRWYKHRVSLTFGQVWQDPTLMRKRTVEENLEIAARIGVAPTRRKMRERIEKVLGLVGMPGSEKMYPAELSCGEGRRVELARALINSPPVLVLDEITANLDDENIWDIFQLLQEVNRRGTTVVMATHASQYVTLMRRRVVTMVDGRIFGDVQKGKYGDVV